jgi:hypothetical protein
MSNPFYRFQLSDRTALTEREKIAVRQFLAANFPDYQITTMHDMGYPDYGVTDVRVRFQNLMPFYADLRVEVDGDMNIEVSQLPYHWC